MSTGLCLHAGARHVTREELAKVATPEATRTWRPVPHHEVAGMVAAAAVAEGYTITSEDYGLNQAGTRMFGVLKFAPQGHPEYTRALGIRNSHDKSFALGLVAGVSVFVCDNMAFGGETAVHRKHTSGIDLAPLLPPAFGRVAQQFIQLEHSIDGLKMRSVTVDEARVITVMAAELRVIPSCDILPVLDGFRNPVHEEFRPSTRWSLYNSFTDTAKKYSPARADSCYRGLSRLFGLDPSAQAVLP